MNFVSVIDIGPNGYNFCPFLYKIKGVPILKIFLDKLVFSNLYGEKIYLNAQDKLYEECNSIVKSYESVSIIQDKTGGVEKYNSIREYTFFKNKYALIEILQKEPDCEYIQFFQMTSIIFDKELVQHLQKITFENRYQFARYSLNFPYILDIPCNIEKNYLKNILENKKYDEPKYFYPFFYMLYEAGNMKVNAEVIPPKNCFNIPYDLKHRKYLNNFSTKEVLDYINICMETNGDPPDKFSIELFDKYFSLPDRFAIELGFSENSNTVFYPNIKNKRQEWIDVSYVEQLLSSLKDFPFFLHLDLTGFRDPLMHPEILKILKLLNDFKLLRKEKYSDYLTELTIYTNGEGLVNDVINAILENSIDNLILNTFTGASDNYTELTGLNLNFETIESNFINFLNKKYGFMEQNDVFNKNNVKPETGIAMILCAETEKNVKEFIEKWNKNKNYISSGKTYLPAELNSKWEQFYKQEKFPLEHAVIYNYNSYCGKNQDRSVADFTPLKRFPCRKLLNGCVLLTNGNISICEQDVEGEYIFASSEFDLLNDIILNEKYQQWRRNHINNIFNEPEICNLCKQYYIPVY